MGRLFTYLKRNISVAFKSVKNGKRQFFPFALAIFLIAALLFTLTLAFDNNKTQREEKIRAEYDYHVLISGLREKEYNALKEQENPPALNQKTFTIVKTVDREDTDGGAYHFDLYIRLERNEERSIFSAFKSNNPEKIFASFKSQNYEILYESRYDIGISFSPLYELEVGGSDTTLLYTVTILVFALIAIFILSSLYNVRLNHYKFIYGIYSAFGADFKKLRRSAFYEMTVIFLVTVIPAYLLSIGLCLFIYLSNGLSFSLSFFSSLKVLLFLIPILFISTRIPMRLLSRTEPMRLIVSENNENWVSHRGRSVSLFKSKFPAKYELHTALRFRRYLFRLALNSALFSILFCFGVYLSFMYSAERHARSVSEYEYSLTFKDPSALTDPEISDILAYYSQNGTVSDVKKNYSSALAEDVVSHMLVGKEHVKFFSGLTKSPETAYTPSEKTYAVSRLEYFCASDNDLLRIFDETYGINYTGDLNSILDDNTVIIANTYNNREVFKYEVGDTIWLAVYDPTYFAERLAELHDPDNEEYDPNAYIDSWGNLMTKKNGKEELIQAAPKIKGELAGTELLKAQMKTFKFKYVPFKIGAIIENYSTSETGIPVIMNQSAYELVTGETIKPQDTLYVSLENDAKRENILALEDSLRQYISGKDIALASTGLHFKTSVESLYHYDLLILLLSSILLIFIPIVWFFTQILFYKKRENEFYILQSIGAKTGQIRNLHLFNAVLMLPVGILSLLLSLGAVALIYYLKNSFWSVLFGSASLLTTQFYLPPLALASIFIVCFICSFLSSLIPYFAYRRKKDASQERNDIIFYAE